MNVNEMTAAECADWCAAQNGWRIFNMPVGPRLYLAPGKPEDADCQTECPYPLTLDGAAAALPDGVCGLVIERKFDWFNGEVHAKAYSPMGWGRCGALWIHTYGPDELTARYRLAVACGMAEKEQKT